MIFLSQGHFNCNGCSRHKQYFLSLGSRVGAVVRALASHQCVPGSIPGPGVISGLTLLLVLLLCSERFFSGYCGFPLSSKTNISNFQFDLDVRHFSHEPLARVIAQALPVLDVKFTLTLFLSFLSVSFLTSRSIARYSP